MSSSCFSAFSMVHIAVLFACLCVASGSISSFGQAMGSWHTVVNSTSDLPSNIADISQLTISGLSAGGYFAVQFQVSYSSLVKGVGVFAGGPYWCAGANVAVATTACMSQPELISIDALIAATDYAEVALSIDATSNMKNTNVYVFSGSEDSIVEQGVVKKLQQYYEHYVDPMRIKARYDIPAEHALATDDFGSTCDFLGSPFMNNCGFDSVGDMLTQLYGSVNAPAAEAKLENLYEFDQTAFMPKIVVSHDLISLGESAYVYIPSVCQTPGAKCKIHVAMHGCEMTIADIGLLFVEKSKYIRYAESNNMIILFPQAETTAQNPKGCFDWWGFSSPAYATKLGPQIITVYNMISHFANGSTKQN
eukprot:ANDGO_02584.mRNA.1 polyhydroxybutyrate depolymerase